MPDPMALPSKVNWVTFASGGAATDALLDLKVAVIALQPL